MTNNSYDIKQTREDIENLMNKTIFDKNTPNILDQILNDPEMAKEFSDQESTIRQVQQLLKDEKKLEQVKKILDDQVKNLNESDIAELDKAFTEALNRNS
jgi:hypothetical protein